MQQPESTSLVDMVCLSKYQLQGHLYGQSKHSKESEDTRIRAVTRGDLHEGTTLRQLDLPLAHQQEITVLVEIGAISRDTNFTE